MNISQKELLIMSLLKNSSTEELRYMYENGERNELAKKCFLEEIGKRESTSTGGTLA